MKKLTIQMGANSKLSVVPEKSGFIPEMITVPYNCVPMPTPTTPKYIRVRGQRRQSIRTRPKSLRPQGRA